MAPKFLWLFTFMLIYFIIEIESSFIKGKNIPRVGRSNEADGFYDHEMGYVIKTIPSKNIPRMGRRNYDSENRYDIPKIYGIGYDTQDDNQDPIAQHEATNEQLEYLYGGK